MADRVVAGQVLWRMAGFASVRHRGTLASRAVIRPRTIFLQTIRPCSHPLFAVAIVTVVLKVRTAQDYIGGVALIALSLFALWASSDLQGMREFSFGAGTAPRMFWGADAGARRRIATGCALTALNDVCIDKSALRHSSCHQEACVVGAEAVPYKAGRTEKAWM